MHSVWRKLCAQKLFICNVSVFGTRYTWFVPSNQSDSRTLQSTLWFVSVAFIMCIRDGANKTFTVFCFSSSVWRAQWSTLCPSGWASSCSVTPSHCCLQWAPWWCSWASCCTTRPNKCRETRCRLSPSQRTRTTETHLKRTTWKPLTDSCTKTIFIIIFSVLNEAEKSIIIIPGYFFSFFFSPDMLDTSPTDHMRNKR